MLELRSDHDLALEALGAHSRGQIRRQNFHDDATAEGAFLGEKDATPPPAADLAVQGVRGAQRGLKLILKVGLHTGKLPLSNVMDSPDPSPCATQLTTTLCGRSG